MKWKERTEEEQLDVLVEGSDARARLLTRLDSPESRRRALLLDPGLAARRMRDAQFDDAEVAEVSSGVMNARRLLDAGPSLDRPRRQAFSALLVALAMGLVFLLPVGSERSERQPGEVGPPDPFSGPAMTHPAVEAVSPRNVRVYELAEEEFSVVWFIDESFEL